MNKCNIMSSPFEFDQIEAVLSELQARGSAQLLEDGVDRAEHKFALSVDMRHRGQINEVEVDLDP